MALFDPFGVDVLLNCDTTTTTTTHEASDSPATHGSGLSDVKKLATTVHGLGNWTTLDGDLRDALTILASALRAVIASDLYNDSVVIGQEVRSLTFGTCTAKDWLRSRNTLLMAFLQSCTDISFEASVKKTNALIYAVEQVLYRQNVNSV